MKKIPLTKGYSTIIDDEDFAKCSYNKWHVTSQGYAARRANNKIQYLHRFLLNAPKELEVDHINGNPLDNRKSNLRLCNRLQNIWNSKKTSKYARGVRPNKNGFMAMITTNKVRKYLGTFRTIEEAAVVYKKAALEQRGEFLER